MTFVTFFSFLFVVFLALGMVIEAVAQFVPLAVQHKTVAFFGAECDEVDAQDTVRIAGAVLFAVGFIGLYALALK